MKIHSSQYIQANKLYKTQVQSPTVQEDKKDKVEISKEALELNAQTSKVKEERLQELKQQIEEGTYVFQPEKTAQAIMAAWKESGVIR